MSLLRLTVLLTFSIGLTTSQSPLGSLGPQDISPTGPDAFTGFQGQNPGSTNALGQRFQFTGQDLKNIRWERYDRRAEEGWWHLYPFGEKFYDIDIADRPWLDRQIDLDFFFPYYGFRFNYTFIFPEGFIAFSYPYYIQPPYTFPTPGWPNRPDASLIAAFMTDQTFMSVGESRISHVWYRVISRPPNMIGQINNRQQPDRNRPDAFGSSFGNVINRYFDGQLLKTQHGRLEDPEFLNQISRDIAKGQIGARGFTADFALIVTWERMAYGGSPKSTQLNLYEQTKRSQNTYQMVIATDEIRSFVMFNYANINWTSSTSAGALFGRGGKQSAIVGFNGGNGTGFYELPYSAEGNSFKLVQFGSTQTAGRWQARVDEGIKYGGCTNTSVGVLQVHTRMVPMLGGFALNVSGPCFRANARIKLQIDLPTIDCERVDMVVARCVIPVDSFSITGLAEAKLSIDGGQSYPFWTMIYIMQPALSRRPVGLIENAVNLHSNFHDPHADNLTVKWNRHNITTDPNSQIDITLWGYWEDQQRYQFIEIGAIGKNLPNTGIYAFDPRTLDHNSRLKGSWKKFQGGVIQIRVSDNLWTSDKGDGIYWSGLVPFGWYFIDIWQREMGNDWAMELCKDWFEWDGKRENFIMEVEPTLSCPCTLSQALADFGRFTPLQECDMACDSYCYYTSGAAHCVISSHAAWNGASQMCCYDNQGWLMFSDDYEYYEQYLNWASAGYPYRAHPWGSNPYRRPPFIPSLSNYFNDLLPYDICCKWAGHCELFYWRRQSSPCIEYRPPKMAFAYGDPHFITFDGVRYTFNGKGYYILAMMKSPKHDLMIQARMEQPPKTIWDAPVQATIITGIAASDNGSSTIQVFARKNFRRWRYRTDVYVDGFRLYMDVPHKKLYNFPGVTVRSPSRNMNMSEIEILFDTGVGVRVTEGRGLLNAVVSLPPSYNETYAHAHWDTRRNRPPPPPATGQNKCANYYRTLGLLGTYNDDRFDDLTTPDCNIVSAGFGSDNRRLTAQESRTVYYEFGEKWRVSGDRHRLLFQTNKKPLYNPGSFANPNFQPIFDVDEMSTNQTFWSNLIFTREAVTVACQSVATCEYDYIVTGRKEIGLDTLSAEKKFEGLKQRGEQKLKSCGPLVKNRGVIKYPQGNNYLDGVTVTFSCKPEYFMHGDQQRTCVNGTWSAGWWPWCRLRKAERALKWLVGIGFVFLLIVIILCIFCGCRFMRLARKKKYYESRGIYTKNPKQKDKDKSKRSPQMMPSTPFGPPIQADQVRPSYATPVQTPIRHPTPIRASPAVTPGGVPVLSMDQEPVNFRASTHSSQQFMETSA